jgi:CDP-diacylglycerol--glycerol-3-phosphate 3-phosphatidyltransferase
VGEDRYGGCTAGRGRTGLTLANTITLVRLFIIPIFVFFMLWPWSGAAAIAFFLFLVATLTDWLDGYIARRSQKVTQFGRLADPFADRILVISALATLFLRGVFSGTLALIFFISVILRDIALVLGYVVVRTRGKTISVNLFGKVTNFILMGTLVLLVFQVAFFRGSLFLWAFYAAAILYLLSGLVYIIQGAQQISRE